MSSTLCQRCRALEFDDTALGGYKAGSERRGFYLKVEHPVVSNKVHLEYYLKDDLPSLAVLSESANEGCGFCLLLKASLKEHTPPTARQVEVRLSYQWNTSSAKSKAKKGLGYLKAHITLNGPDNNSHTIYLHFYIDGAPGQSTQWLRLEPSPRSEALCDENISWISQHLSETAHIQCPASSVANYPNRLVYIGDTTSNICRLVDTRLDSNVRDDAMGLEYIALSYCWGSPEDAAMQTTTTQASLQMRKKGFHFDTLSPVLQDAIRVCRAFNIYYIWVDALCIIQDDHIDWGRESARMFLVYQHAYFTLCATASNSCRQGFLERRRPTATVEFQSKVDENIRGSYTLRSPSIQQSATSIAIFDPWQLDLLKSTWSSRAWTFQELRMSTRVLLFGSYTIHFLTTDSVYSEMTENNPILKTEDCSEFVNIGRTLSDYHGLQRIMFRRRLIERYARKKITNHSDKLPAFGGIASIAFQDDPNQYVAGLCRQDLHIELFWRTDFRIITSLGHSKPATRTELINSLESREGYVAPSWSWASAKNNIIFRQLKFELDDRWSEIKKEYLKENVSICLEGASPFGRVEDGSLVLTTTILPIPQDVRPPPDGYNPNRSKEAESRHKVMKGNNIVAYIDFDWDILQPEDSMQESLESMFLVLIGSCKCYGVTPFSGSSSKDEYVKPRPTEYERDDTANLGDKRNPNETYKNEPQAYTLGKDGCGDEQPRIREKEAFLEPFKLESRYSSETCKEIINSDHDYEHTELALDKDKYDVAAMEGTSAPRDEKDVMSDILDDDSVRYAYGLVVHKSEKLNAYLRVGIFSSWPEKKGGVKYFRDGPIQSIRIV